MAKRFTDTEKWKKKWFRCLPLKMKCTWVYLCDMCDHAGVWESDFDLMTVFIGDLVTPEELEKAFHGRILKLQDGKKYLLLGFIKFQYVTLKAGNRTHDSARSILKNVAPHINTDSLSDYPKPFDTLCIPYTSPILTPSEITEALSGVLEGRKDTGTGFIKDTGTETLLLSEATDKDFKKPTFILSAS